MAYIYDLADTWNSGTTTFTGIKLNVTDSASTVGSLLMDLQVGGVSKFNVRKDGSVTAGNGVSNNMVFTPVANSLVVGVAGIVTGGIRHITGSSITLLSGSAYSTTHATDAMLNGALGLVGWHSSTYSFQNLTPDLALYRDAANTLAQRNGAAAQAFHLYNSYSSSTIYERGFMKWENNEFQIGTAAAGTGVGRAVSLRTANGRYLTLSDGTTLDSNAVYYRFFAAGVTIANLNINTKQFVMGLGGSFAFSSGADSFGTAADVGIARDAAGVAKITNGSTGAGKLIFIVPTTDPGITGALWNNAGTLSISA